MAVISSKVLNFGDPSNKMKYNVKQEQQFLNVLRQAGISSSLSTKILNQYTAAGDE